MKTCDAVINLAAPFGSERAVAFRPGRTIFRYRCRTCGAERRVYASAYQGKRAVPAVGGIVCGALIASAKETPEVKPWP